MYKDSFIKNPSTMGSVLHDGTTIGEFMIKSSIVMNGYFKNAEATTKAFENGWRVLFKDEHKGLLLVLSSKTLPGQIFLQNYTAIKLYATINSSTIQSSI